MYILATGFIASKMRELFSWIDTGIYWLFEKIVLNLFKVAYADIFSQKIINELMNRIYVILGIFILFKLAFSIVTYIISPDAMSDKEKGFGKIITRVIISLILLVLVPSIFSYAKQAQGYILPVIPRVIIGKDFTSTSDYELNNGENSNVNYGSVSQETLEGIAKAMSFYSYLVVFNYNEVCKDEQNTILGSPDTTPETIKVASVNDVPKVIVDECSGMNTTTGDDEYRYRYIPLVGTVIGCFLIYTMLGITIDVAIRTIKLGLLQVLAPVPIISYIDPKASKDGAFANWVKACITTYVDLFLRIGLVYFMMFLFDALFQGEVLSGNDPLVTGSIIIGLFFFVKTAPKFITDILGIKGDAGLFRSVMTGHGITGLVGGMVGGSFGAKAKGGSALVGGLSGLGASTKKFFQNGFEGKSGGISGAGLKAGQESQKINTGWRGRANRASGESRASALGLTSAKVDELGRQAKFAERDLGIAERKLQEARLHGASRDEQDRAENEYNEFYKKYKSANGTFEKAKTLRGDLVKSEPYEEKLAREMKANRRGGSTASSSGRGLSGSSPRVETLSTPPRSLDTDTPPITRAPSRPSSPPGIYSGRTITDEERERLREMSTAREERLEPIRLDRERRERTDRDPDMDFHREMRSIYGDESMTADERRAEADRAVRDRRVERARARARDRSSREE